MVKNLVSYLYIRDPNNIEDSLGVNLRCIQKYYHIFDGIRVIYISTDFQISEPQKDEILRKIGIKSAEFVINDPESRESKFFIEQKNGETKEEAFKNLVDFLRDNFYLMQTRKNISINYETKPTREGIHSQQKDYSMA